MKAVDILKRAMVASHYCHPVSGFPWWYLISPPIKLPSENGDLPIQAVNIDKNMVLVGHVYYPTKIFNI